jgi:hypothetical protein
MSFVCAAVMMLDLRGWWGLVDTSANILSWFRKAGSRDPRSGVYASSGATRLYEAIGGGVTDRGECLILGYPAFRSWESSSCSPGASGRSAPYGGICPRVPLAGLGEDGDPGADPARPDPALVAFCNFLMYSSRCSASNSHFMPFPGSSVRRGIFRNALLSERLCLMEF